MKPYLLAPTPVDVDRLTGMQPNQLRALYRHIFTSAAPTSNSELMRRRIAWQLQAGAESGLPESARQRALGIARTIKRPIPAARAGSALVHSSVARLISKTDSRLPPPGTVLVKEFRGKQLIVRVLTTGFEYENRIFPSLSAVATEITGTKWNGFLFFGLTRERRHGR